MLPAALLCIVATALATSPQVSYPLNLQLPPVARVGKAYSFQFAATTFQPNPDELVYSIASGPSWLRIHSENRTLYGTPEEKDAGTATFTITAAGEAGVAATLESQLPVEKDDGPRLAGNVSQALAKAGQLSGPSSVTLLPSKPFEITFGRDLFQTNGKALSYHTTLKDHTPLPAWIGFDPESLRFTGTTPSSASPQTIDILLIASDNAGFAAASTLFSVDVSNHILLFKPLQQTVNVSKGEHVEIKGLKGMIFLDNSPLRDDDIQSASADLPKWLSFDNSSFDITGDPPSGLMSQNITVTVQDRFGDSAQHTIHLSFTSQLFTGEVGRLNITPGVLFEHHIPKSILTLDNETVMFEFGQLGKWLTVDSQSLTISGTLPNDTAACSIEGSMTATSPDGKVKDTQTFWIDVLGTTTSNTSKPLNSGTSTDSHAQNAASTSSRKRIGIIVGAVLASLFSAAVIIVLALSLCHRRRKHEPGYLSPNLPRSPQKTDISRPILNPHISIASGWGEIDKVDDDLEKGKEDASPPQVTDVPTKTLSRKKITHSRDTSLDEREDTLCTWLDRDVTFSTEAGPSHHPHDSMKIPTEMLRRKPAGSPSQQRRHTRTSLNRISHPPLNRRLTLDRGPHAHSPSQGTTDSSNTTTLSTVPSAPLQPSRARHTTHLTTPLSARPSIRSVVPSTYETPLDRLIDRRTLDEKRHSYIRKRASAQQSPLFAGSRASSSTFKEAPRYLETSSPAHTQKSPLSVVSPNIVRPDDSILSAASEVPESLRIRMPGDTPSPSPSPSPAAFDLSRSLRKKSARGVFQHHLFPSEERTRPSTALYNPTSTSVPSSPPPSALRSENLLLDLNTATNTEIWDDTDRSESNYSGDELDILEASRRTTLRPGSHADFAHVIPLEVIKQKKRASKRRSPIGGAKPDSGKDKERVLKRASERDPTPFHRASRDHEHGGKENASRERGSSPPKGVPAPKSDAPPTPLSLRPSRENTSPSRRTPSTGAPLCATRPTTSHARAPSRALPPLPPSSPQERHSRRSLHSRSASRHSGSAMGPKTRERSATQDSAYPFFGGGTAGSAAGGKGASTATTRARRSYVEARDGGKGEGGEDGGRRDSGGVAQRKVGEVKMKRKSPFYHSKRDTVVAGGARGSGERRSVVLGGRGREEMANEAWGKKGRGSGSPGRMSVWGGDADAKALI